MTPELKAKWVAALRSGKYKQTTNILRSNDDHFCCLGVLCDVFNKEGWKKEAHENGYNEAWNFHHEVDHAMRSLPMSLRLNVGMYYKMQDDLVDLNDKAKKNFNEIADWIEENVVAT